MPNPKIVNLAIVCQSCGKPISIVSQSTVGIPSFVCLRCGMTNTLPEEQKRIDRFFKDKKPKKPSAS